MILAIFRKELRSIVRERTFISTLLLQLFLIIFYSVAILGIMVIFSPNLHGHHRAQILVADNEFIDRHFVDLLRKDHDAVVGDLSRASDFDLAIEFTKKDPAIMYVYTKDESFATTYILSELKKVLLQYEEDRMPASIIKISPFRKASGLDINRMTVIALVFEFKYFLLVPLLLFLPIYLSGVLYIDLFTEEVARKTLSMLRAAPVSLLCIINQKLLAALVVSIAQIVAWIMVLELRHIPISNKPEIILVLVLLNLAVLLIACLISLVFTSRAIAQTVFSFAVIAALVTRGFSYNPLNLVTKLAVIDVPWLVVAGFIAGLCVVVLGFYLLLSQVASRAKSF
jgi:ABC-2 type transport system permease protein